MPYRAGEWYRCVLHNQLETKKKVHRWSKKSRAAFTGFRSPCPGTLLGSVNAYVIKGRERNLIIDPGMNLDACMQTMDEGLRQIGVDAATSDFFITHSHPDHFPWFPG